MNYKTWIKLNTSNLTNKTIVITGSTGGIGTDICKILAHLNCNLVLLNRNVEKSNKQKIELLKINSKIDVKIFQVDLSDIKQVKDIINKLNNITIDFLIYNAGVYNVPIKITETGYNNVFTINFISPYYITKELLPNLEANKSKVVVVSSIAHNYSKLKENDVDFSTHKKSSKIYGNSKRFLMFSMFELFKNSNANLSVCHPGITLTNMTNHYPKAINWLVKLGIKVLFPTPTKASLNIIKAMFEKSNYFEWIGPKIFNIWGKPVKKKLKTCTQNESEQIFQIAEEIYTKIKTD